MSNDLTEDINLIIRFKGGDLSAFEEFVHKNEDRIYNLCRYMLHDTQDAQDAAQDTFIKAYKGLQGFHPEASLSTWLYRIAVNTCLDHQKKSRHGPLSVEALSEDLLSSDPSPEDKYQSKKATEAIHTALQKLPEKLRSAIVLREIEELTYEEIALILDTSVGTVKSRISRAREEIRVLFHGKL